MGQVLELGVEHADVLKEIANVLGYIAAALAILCLFIPGVDLLIFAAMAVTAMLLVIQTMLAATGNGSWLDVALDVLGLVTLGMGLGAADEVEGLANGARGAATAAWKDGATELLDEYKPAFNLFRSLTDEEGALTDMGRTGVKFTMQAIKNELPMLPQEMEEAGGFWAKTAAQFKTGVKTWTSLDNVVSTFTHAGDPGIAAAKDAIDSLAQAYPAVTQVTDAVGASDALVGLGRCAAAASQITRARALLQQALSPCSPGHLMRPRQASGLPPQQVRNATTQPTT